jgi:hypothetical protein
MTQQLDPVILELKNNAINAMASYIKFGVADHENDPDYDPEFEAGYTQKHIDLCSAIIDEFLVSLDRSPETRKNEYIMKSVKKAVLALNDLNEECNGDLIETAEREDLCELINVAAGHAGLESNEDDITEEWRHW